MLYLCTWKCHNVLVCAQAKVHHCRLIWLHGRPRPFITWCCTVVDNMSVVGTKAPIPEMLESALEHEILYSVTYLILFWEIWNIAALVQNRQKRLWWRCFLACPKTTVACCRLPKIKLWSTHGYLPPEDTSGHFHDLGTRFKGTKTTFLRYELPIHCRFQRTINFLPAVSLLNHKSHEPPPCILY